MLEFFRRFLPYIKGHLMSFGIAMLGGIIAALCTAGVTYLVKPMLDEVFINKDLLMLKLLPALLVLMYCGKAIGAFIQTYFMGYIGEDIIRVIRNEMLEKMLFLDLSFFQKNRNGELLARITNDIGLIRVAVSTIIADFVREGLTAIALISVVIYQSPKLALVSLVVVPLAIFPLSIIVRKLKKFSRKTQEKNADITSRLNEIFNNIEVIKTSSGESLELDHFKKENNEFFKINMKAFLINHMDNPTMEILGAFVVGSVILVGGHNVIGGEMSAGAFFSFTAALFMAYTPIKRLINSVIGMQSAIVASDRILEIMDQKPQIVDGEQSFEGRIEKICFDSVSFGYEEEEILHKISLEVKRNEIIALVGRSGSGKSSLISLLLRLYEPRAGKILINAEDYRNFRIRDLREQIALVNQRIFIFNDSIAHNVAYGKEVDEERVIWALKKALIWDFVSSLEQGIYSKLDEFGANLSGGQRQRIAIARALYRNPQVLILDEATSALDARTEEAFKEVITEVAKDRTIIIIAHRPSTIELAHKVYFLEEGRLRESEGLYHQSK